MLKKTVTYTDYNDQEVTEDFYFHLSRAELVELELSEINGFAQTLQEIVKAGNGKKIIEQFKRLILGTYGVKSEDGRRFIKSDELRTEFEQSEAFSTLFFELATNAQSAAEFINGIIPHDLAEKLEELQDSAVDASSGVIEAVLPPDEPEDPTKPKKKLSEMTREELIEAFKNKNDAKIDTPPKI